MLMKKSLIAAAFASATLFSISPAISAVTGLTPVGRYVHNDNGDGEGGAEIVAYDKMTQRLFVVNAANDCIDVLDASTPSNLTFVYSIDVTSVTGLTGGSPNSVDAYNGLVAIAIEADTKQDNGVIAFFDAASLEEQKVIEAGSLPDMVTFTPNGMMALAANEGEPSDDYSNDPEGSVTLIDLSSGVTNSSATQIGFSSFNNQKDDLIENGVRIFGPNASVAQDLEPEYITISADSKTAWVGLQENNALAEIDIETASITRIYPFGFKDHSVEGNGFDASNKDDAINIQTHNTLGMYQPDAITSFATGGKTYVLTANEGDSRDYAGFSEEYRVSDFAALDTTNYPSSDNLQSDENLGRLKTTSTLGIDTISTPNCDYTSKDSVEGVCEYDQIYSYGARSFSIWDSSTLQASGNAPTFDSGDEFEQIIAADSNFSVIFNANGDENQADNRSDDKGTEPEAVTTGKIGSKVYAFVGLERIGGIMIYDITIPSAASYITYVNFRNLNTDLATAGHLAEEPANVTLSDTDAGDIGPEGVEFIPASDSGDNKAYLVVANEISNTTTMYEIDGAEDTDGDGVPNTEDSSPNDASSVEIMAADGSSTTWNVAVSKGNIADAEIIQIDDPSINTTGKPSDYTFNYDVVSYNIEGLTAGDSVDVQLTYPTAIPNGANVYKITDSGFEEFAANFSGDVATITLVDGGVGDADGTANGVIVDPVTIGESTTSDNSGGGNFGVLLLGLMAMLVLIRRQFN